MSQRFFIHEFITRPASIVVVETRDAYCIHHAGVYTKILLYVLRNVPEIGQCSM